jgi:hypothetical protein
VSDETEITVTIDGQSRTFRQPATNDNVGRVYELARDWLKERHAGVMKAQAKERREAHMALQVKELRRIGADARADALERGDLVGFYTGAPLTEIKPKSVKLKVGAKGVK